MLLHLKADLPSWHLGETTALTSSLSPGKALEYAHRALGTYHKTPINFLSMGGASFVSLTSPWHQSLPASDPFDHPHIITAFSYKTESEFRSERCGDALVLLPPETAFCEFPIKFVKPTSWTCLPCSLASWCFSIWGPLCIHGPFTKQGVWWLLSHSKPWECKLTVLLSVLWECS